MSAPASGSCVCRQLQPVGRLNDGAKRCEKKFAMKACSIAHFDLTVGLGVEGSREGPFSETSAGVPMFNGSREGDRRNKRRI